MAAETVAETSEQMDSRPYREYEFLRDGPLAQSWLRVRRTAGSEYIILTLAVNYPDKPAHNTVSQMPLTPDAARRLARQLFELAEYSKG